MNARDIVRVGIAIMFIGSGIIHFTNADFFENLVPARLEDYSEVINEVSGVLLLCMGVAFLVPQFRAFACGMSIILLVVTFPIIVSRVFHPAGMPQALAITCVAAWLLMIALIWWATKSDDRSK